MFFDCQNRKSQNAAALKGKFIKTPNFLIFWFVLPNPNYISNAKILPKKSDFLERPSMHAVMLLQIFFILTEHLCLVAAAPVHFGSPNHLPFNFIPIKTFRLSNHYNVRNLQL